MLELYHHGSSVCAAKVRFALAEKDIDWTGHYIDVLAGDQFDKQYMKLNPKALVPTLVHDGQVIVESTVINEYLEEAFDERPLRPTSPASRAAMRLWTKAVDEDVHPACGEITFVSCHRHIVNRMPREKIEEFLESTPALSATPYWHNRKREIVTSGLAAPGVLDKFKLYDDYLQKMDDALAPGQPWLVGDEFTLADVSLAPYVNRLDMLSMSAMWEGRRPHLQAWFERIKRRPTFESSFLRWCPPDLTADLKHFGALTWEEIRPLMY